MKVIYTTDLSREGNDCYIYEELALVESCDLFMVISCIRVSGWAEREEASVFFYTTDYTKAKGVYEKYGGKTDEIVD